MKCVIDSHISHEEQGFIHDLVAPSIGQTLTMINLDSHCCICMATKCDSTGSGTD